MANMTDLTTTVIPMKSRSWYRATFRDSTGVPIGPTALTSLRLTLYAPFYVAVPPATNIINNRDHQDVLNAHNCTLDTNGHFVWEIMALDTVLLLPTAYEVHVALFDCGEL